MTAQGSVSLVRSFHFQSGERHAVSAEMRGAALLPTGRRKKAMDSQLNRSKRTNQALNEGLLRQNPNSNSSYDLSEIGNGKRFVALFGSDLRFCDVRQIWMVYSGGVWHIDQGGEAERRAKEVSRAVADEAAATHDEDKRTRLLKHALVLTKRATRETMLKDAASELGVRVTPEQFDANPELFNCANGTLNLSTLEFRPHCASDFLTLQSRIEYDPNAECPTWEKCVAQWLPREGVADYAQDTFGLSLTGRIYEEFLNLLIGPGNNGKSTFTRVLENLGGNYWTKTEAETIMRSRDGKKAEAPAPSLLALKGARIVTVQEIDSKHEINAALVKDITGRDTITARGLFEKRPTTFLPQFTLWAFGNSKPKISDASNGMWRRVRIIDFDQVIPANERDPHLKDKLEAELPGILNWALEGLRRVQKRGLIVPEAVSAATNAYRAQQDPLSGFLQEYCDLHPHNTESAARLYDQWKEFCAELDIIPGAKNTFGALLKSRDFESYPGNGERRWRGLSLHLHTNELNADSDKVSLEQSSREDFSGKSVKYVSASVVEIDNEEGDAV